MRIEDFYVCAETLSGVPEEEVAELERAYGVSLPPDYAEWVTRMGSGMWCGGLMVNTPELLTGRWARLEEYRTLMGEYWFWDEAILTWEGAKAAIPVAESDTGDWFVLHPDDATICWLPRDEDAVVRLGSTVGELREWFAVSGALAEPVRMRWFEPHVESVRENWEFEPARAAEVVETIRSSGLVEGEDVEPDLSRFRLTLPAVGGIAYGYGVGGGTPGYLHVRAAAGAATGGVTPLAAPLLDIGLPEPTRWTG